jgi:hypothetical protein
VKWNWRKWLSISALFIISGCLTAILWAAWQLKDYEPFTARDYYPSRPDSYETSFIEGNADITLPPSAHEICAYTTGFQDIFIQVRFSMNADELDEFMRSTLCQEPLRKTELEPPTYDSTSDWWTPDQAEHLKSCTGNKNHSHQTVMVDMTDPSVYIVFVSNSVH